MSEIRELRVVLKSDTGVLKMLNKDKKKVRGRPRQKKRSTMYKGIENIKKETTDDIIDNEEVIKVNGYVPKRRTRAAMKAVPNLFSCEVLELPEIRRKRRKPTQTDDGTVCKTGVEIKRELIEKSSENGGEEVNNGGTPLSKRRKLNPKRVIDLIGAERISVKQEYEFSMNDSAESAGNDSGDLMMINGKDINGSQATETDEDVIIGDYSSIFMDDQTLNSTVNDSIAEGRGQKEKRQSTRSFITVKNNLLATDMDESKEITNPGEQNSLEDRSEISPILSTGNSSLVSGGDQSISPEVYNCVTSKPEERNAEANRKTREDVALNEKQTKASRMKCLNEIISEMFDLKLPEWEERFYLIVKQAQDRRTQEEAKRNAKDASQRKLIEELVLNNLQEIKLLVQKLRGRAKMIDKATQTEGASGNSTEKPSSSGTGVEQHASPRDLAQMIILDSVGSSTDKPSSVFDRLGQRNAPTLMDLDIDSVQSRKICESPRNPPPEALSSVEFQREKIERENRRCNVLMKGFILSRRNKADDINDFIWRKMGIRADVKRVMILGEMLVVTVGSAKIKELILEKRAVLRRTNIVIDNDYTGREKKVQRWLENEAMRRNRGGRVLQVAYQKIKIDGCWWYWNELEGRLNRNEFRSDVIPI